MYNRKRVPRLITLKSFENPIFKYNGVVLNVKSSWITERLMKLYQFEFKVQLLNELIWAQYEMFNQMITNEILQCEKIDDEVIRKPRTNKRKRKKSKKVRKKRKHQRRKQRRIVTGHFDKHIQVKIKKVKQNDKDFKLKKKRFFKLLDDVRRVSNTRILNYTHVINARKYLEKRIEDNSERSSSSSSSNNTDAPVSIECFYVDPPTDTWNIPYSDLSVRIKRPYLHYMQFLVKCKDVKRVIELDKNNELSLRCVSHQWLETSSKGFIKEVPRIVSYERRFFPGLFRIIMMCDEIKKECNDKYSSLKSGLKALHKKGYTPNYGDFCSLDSYDYWKHYFHFTVSDEFLLEIAEYLYWCKKMCLSYQLPGNDGNGNGDEDDTISDDIIFIGGIFLLKYGLKYKNKFTIIPKHPLVSSRGFLIPQNKLGMVLTNRKDASKGIATVTNRLIALCNIKPVPEVAFLPWKKKHGELNNS
jgi:hypothetical protein